jgi:type III restriction enzyme
MPRRQSSTVALPGAASAQHGLITLLQQRVDAWVAAGYAGASELTAALLRHWFDEPHLLPDGRFFAWYAHQRRAVQTAIYLYEVAKARTVEDLAALVGQQRTAQRDPWPKLGLQLATGAGKTKVASLLISWAHLHWALETDLGFGNTQLVIAPNLIVLERLLTDFAAGAIFGTDPLVPPDFQKDWNLRVVTADNVPADCRPSDGYLVVTNIHKLYPEEASPPGPTSQSSLMQLFETPTPSRLDIGAPRLTDFLRQVQSPVAVYNDEAHHVHDEATHFPLQPRQRLDEETKEAVAWHGVLAALQRQSGLALQTDMSATLFEERSGALFRHTVYDYPLRDAIRDGVVKRPYLGKVTLRYRDGHDEPIPLIDDSASNAWDKYSQLLQAGIADWKQAQAALDAGGEGRKAILFIVCNTKSEAGQIAQRLEEFSDPSSGAALFAGRVKELHIGLKESANEQEWRKIRDDVTRIDAADNPYTAVVSVMMLKEGWDVRNVKVIVPLRPCDSRQLTEQLLGRGLRRMFPPYWTPDGELKDRNIAEALYVIRHPSFERVIKDIQDIVEEIDDNQLPSADPTRLVIKPVEPESERLRRDLPIVQIVGAYEGATDWPERLDRTKLPRLPTRFPWGVDLREIDGIIRNEGYGGEAGEEEIHYQVSQSAYSSIEAVIASYAEHVRADLRMARYYEAATMGVVKAFLERCTFDLRGIPLSLDAALDADEETQAIVLANIQRPAVKRAVIERVARIIGEARAGEEVAAPQLETNVRFARDLPAFEAVPRLILQRPRKCVFDACCFDSPDELRLAELLDEADDVAAWLWNDQVGVQFRLQYAYEGRMPYYYPDFLVRLTDGSLWIVEAKGSIRERDRVKQARAERYVELLRAAGEGDWRYLFLINDRAIRREDVAWWSGQGRRLFRDLAGRVGNAPA